MSDTTLTFSEDEILYLLVISGAEEEEIFQRFHLQEKDTTKERLEKGKQSLLSRELILFKDESKIPVINDEVIGLVGAVAVGILDGEYYLESQSEWKAKLQKEGEWYILTGEGPQSSEQ